jgi:hypothetical protein
MAGGVIAQAECRSALIFLSRGAILRPSAGAWHGTFSTVTPTDVERRRFGAYIGSNRRQLARRQAGSTDDRGSGTCDRQVDVLKRPRHGW